MLEVVLVCQLDPLNRLNIGVMVKEEEGLINIEVSHSATGSLKPLTAPPCPTLQTTLGYTCKGIRKW